MSQNDSRSTHALRSNIQPCANAGRGDSAPRFRKPFSRVGGGTLRALAARDDGGLQAADSTDSTSRALFDGGRSASGGGGADGSPLRTARGRGDRQRPNFDISVGPNGYAWWYVDGLSNCGTKAVSVIGFIGSVFSPWYRWSGRKNPQNHVCINVATYGQGGRFTMTDRGKSALKQSETKFEVGPSSMRWENKQLIIDINEVSSPPLINRIKGQIRVTPSAITNVELPLTKDGAHIWRPFAPISHISVNIDRPGWQWSGDGYFDANFGTRALEEDFSYWTWGRYPTTQGATCFYDATRLDGTELASGFNFDINGNAEVIALPPKTSMKRSLWAVRRETRSDQGTSAQQVQNMLDAPFYSRSAVKTTLNGETVVGIHEALDLTRFRSRILKPILAFRVPRRAKWKFK